MAGVREDVGGRNTYYICLGSVCAALGVCSVWLDEQSMSHTSLLPLTDH